MNAATLKLSALADIVENLMKKAREPQWSPKSKEFLNSLAEAKIESDLDDLLRVSAVDCHL